MTAAPLSFVEPDMEISRTALARVVSSRTHSQPSQSPMVQVCIQADPLAGTPAPLTAPMQMFAHPIPHEVVEVAKRPPRVAGRRKPPEEA